NYNSRDQFLVHTDPTGNRFNYLYNDYGQVRRIKKGKNLLSLFTYGTSGGQNGQVWKEKHAILPLGQGLGFTNTTNHFDAFGRNTGITRTSPYGTTSTSSSLDNGDRPISTTRNGNGVGAVYNFENDLYGRNYITHQSIGLNYTEKINHSELSQSNDWVSRVRQGGNANPLHQIDYGYNIKGWITSIGACAGNPVEPPSGGGDPKESLDNQWGSIEVRYNMDDICSQKATQIEITWNAFSGDVNNPTSEVIDKSVDLFGLPALNQSLPHVDVIQYQGPVDPTDMAGQILNRLTNPNGPGNPSANCMLSLESEFGAYIGKVIEDKFVKDPLPPGQDPGGFVPATIFGITLQYENPLGNATPQWNGNISSMQWCTALGETYTYEFGYDHINRLISSETNHANRYGTSYSYDKVGNIETIQRFGVIGEFPEGFSYGLMDNLEYTYTGNILNKVDESANHEYGFKTASKGYGYDGNGNMTSAGDVDIQYTVTNMPHHFTSDNNTILVTYDAAGNKLRKQTPDYVKTYYGPIEFKDGAFEAIYHDQGRTIPSNGGFRTEYNIKDHLGSVRVTYSDINGDGTIDYDTELLQENHYYPFGMVWDGTRLMPDPPNEVNPYQYNGKELTEEIGLDWLDYGFRWYDPSIGRWSAVDPLAELAPNLTPYRYGFNNPIRFTDPFGLYEEGEAKRQRRKAKKAGLEVGEIYESNGEWGFNVIDGDDSYSSFNKDFSGKP
ncbi:MAG: RHS repeat-associated core domain-containing protein, partial [Bacteroidota bacterium]